MSLETTKKKPTPKDETILPVPYILQCKNCQHPAQHHNIEQGCVFRDCDCQDLIKEKLEYEKCVDQNTGKIICVQCMAGDVDLQKGLCKRCTVFEKHKAAVRKKHSDWNDRQVIDEAEKLTKKELKK